MNFDFSDDQKQLRDAARKFLAEKCPPKAVRAVLDGNELTDKGYINQRAGLERRAALVERLYAERPDAEVIILN